MALRLDYFLGEAFINLRRNLFMTFAAISIVAVSLLLLGSVVVFGEVTSRMVGLLDERVELNVFLFDEITPDQTEELESYLTEMPEVRSVEYVSKSAAFEEFKQWYEDTPGVIQNVDADVLPASYRVKLQDPSKVEVVSTRLDGRPGVEQVIFGGDQVRNLLRFNALLRAVVVALTILFLGAATLLIANTIRIAIYARRKEIGVMKLVGATNWFIRVPFILEGMAEAAIGAVIATAVIIAAKEFLLDQAQQVVTFLPLTIGYDEIAQVFGILLIVGMFIGALGSIMAVRRFLEV